MLLALVVAVLSYTLASCAAFALYAFDKLRAKQSQFMPAPRVPEKTLLILSAIGGFPGAMLPMQLVRHKTRKPIFAITNIAAAITHALLWLIAAALWLMVR